MVVRTLMKERGYHSQTCAVCIRDRGIVHDHGPPPETIAMANGFHHAEANYHKYAKVHPVRDHVANPLVVQNHNLFVLLQQTTKHIIESSVGSLALMCDPHYNDVYHNAKLQDGKGSPSPREPNKQDVPEQPAYILTTVPRSSVRAGRRWYELHYKDQRNYAGVMSCPHYITLTRSMCWNWNPSVCSCRIGKWNKTAGRLQVNMMHIYVVLRFAGFYVVTGSNAMEHLQSSNYTLLLWR